jgi:hypothetical protein
MIAHEKQPRRESLGGSCGDRLLPVTHDSHSLPTPGIPFPASVRPARRKITRTDNPLYVADPNDPTGTNNKIEIDYSKGELGGMALS